MDLKTHIFALIDAKMKLMAALDDVDTQLKEAYSVLREIPSNVSVAAVDKVIMEIQPAVTVVKTKKKQYNQMIVEKKCAVCGIQMMAKKRRLYCRPCFADMARERMKKTMENKREKEIINASSSGRINEFKAN